MLAPPAFLMPKSWTFLRADWPAHWRVLLVAGLYAAYLPLSNFIPADFRYDAAHYWNLSLRFYQHHHFSVLEFDEPLRGYLGPLLIFPLRALCYFTGLPALTGARVLGVGWAALLYGLVIPGLWQQTTGRLLPAGRWLLLLALSFLFWRDHFNFTLSDFPALTLLLLALLAVQRRGSGWALLAGLALAGAINMRPIYLASLPGVLLLAGHCRTLPRPGRRLAAGMLGLSLVLLPQLRINQLHFGQNTPLVLAKAPGQPPLYLRQLVWGTRAQRYETTLVPGWQGALFYLDPAGLRALPPAKGAFRSYADYLQFVARQPLAVGGRYIRHLFNGLDVQFASPYVRALDSPGRLPLRLLNYLLLAVGGGLLLQCCRRLMPQPAAGAGLGVGLALALPCVLALPTLIECRFLLPLHLLLLTLVAGAGEPRQWWQQLRTVGRRAAALLLLVLWVGACWALSEDTARQLAGPGPLVESVMLTD
jgi:hypothetical protein